MNERTDLVEFCCVAHQRDGAEELVTLYEGHWAFCPAHRDDAHRWRRIAPVELATLRAPGRPRFVGPDSEASVA